MKLAICNETFQDWPFEKACAYARDLGYTGIEIAPFTLAESALEISADQRGKVRRQAADAGLAVIGLHWPLIQVEIPNRGSIHIWSATQNKINKIR